MDYRAAVELYTQGSCHAFAIAVAREHDNAPILVVFDATDDSIIHCFASLTDNIYVDITGAYSYTGVHERIMNDFNVNHRIAMLMSEQQMREELIDSDDDYDRALCAISEEDITEARNIYVEHVLELVAGNRHLSEDSYLTPT